VVRILAVCAGGVLLASGCSPQASFQPETLEIGPGRLTVKGWTRSDRFCIELRLDSAQRAWYLHSVHLVAPDGREHPPDNWNDKTPKPPTVGVSLGMGFRAGGEGHGEPHPEHAEGGGTSIAPGVGFPLKLGRDSKGITAIEACWDVSRDGRTSPVEGCTLEVNLSSMQPDRIEVATVSLAMAYHEDEDSAPAPDEDGQPARETVREVDFTLKGPEETRTIPT
jgi:hypothetical protein